MNMNVNFTGLNNSQFTAAGGQTTTGNIKMDAYRFYTELSDDDKGNHLNDFFASIKKSKIPDNKYVNKYFPEDVVLFDIAKLSIGDEMNCNKTIWTFVLNGEALKLNNDNVLPIFSFLAKAVRKAGNEATTSYDKQIAKEMDKNLEKAILNYLG